MEKNFSYLLKKTLEKTLDRDARGKKSRTQPLRMYTQAMRYVGWRNFLRMCICRFLFPCVFVRGAERKERKQQRSLASPYVNTHDNNGLYIYLYVNAAQKWRHQESKHKEGHKQKLNFSHVTECCRHKYFFPFYLFFRTKYRMLIQLWIEERK